MMMIQTIGMSFLLCSDICLFDQLKTNRILIWVIPPTQTHSFLSGKPLWNQFLSLSAYSREASLSRRCHFGCNTKQTLILFKGQKQEQQYYKGNQMLTLANEGLQKHQLTVGQKQILFNSTKRPLTPSFGSVQLALRGNDVTRTATNLTFKIFTYGMILYKYTQTHLIFP